MHETHRVEDCALCTRYARLRGQWPIQREAKNMSVSLTDAQIVRLFELCEKVLKVKRSVPLPPNGFGDEENAQLEAAKNVRSSLERENSVLVELGALLR
jgi:hypothetical protein